MLWKSTEFVFPSPLEDAEASLTLKGSGHTSSAPDERNHSFLLDTHTHANTGTRSCTCTEGCLDQRAAVLFGRLTSDPFRAAHTGASCNAEPVLLRVLSNGKTVVFLKVHADT